MKTWKGYEHGINFGGWLSQCTHTTEHYDTFITAEDFRTVREWGLDHIRIPVDYELFETRDGVMMPERFRYLDFAIEECRKNGLNMILDLHRTPGFSFDPGHNEAGFFDNESYQDHFYKIWDEFARRYGRFSGFVAFELLNEVTDKAYCDTWNRVANTCIDRIRAIAPDVYILVGGYYNNSLEAVRDIAMPRDSRIIYNFHCYEPLLFTHQGATWIASMDPAYRCPFKMPYRQYAEDSVKQLGAIFASSFSAYDPEATPDETYFEKLFADALAVAEERDVPLYCGEYGVIDRVAPEEVLSWYRAFHTVMKRYSIGSAAWSYRAMDFGIADARLDGVRDELLAVIRHEA